MFSNKICVPCLSSACVQDDEVESSSLVIATSDPAANLYPTKPKDFTAFVNLVDFCRYAPCFLPLLIPFSLDNTTSAVVKSQAVLSALYELSPTTYYRTLPLSYEDNEGLF